MRKLKRALESDAPNSVLLIRLLVGFIFLSEGIQKFLYADSLGSGRFLKIGLPFPEFLGPFVASFEVVSGSFILLGLLTRLAVIPTITIMIFALITTKIPILCNEGFWKMAHEARTDLAMLLTSIFLFIVGSGSLSIDAQWLRKRGNRDLPRRK